jgi:hypothetical protein
MVTCPSLLIADYVGFNGITVIGMVPRRWIDGDECLRVEVA